MAEQLENEINAIERGAVHQEASGINKSYQNLSVFGPYLRFRVDEARRHPSATWRWRVGKVGRDVNRLNEWDAKAKVRVMTLVSVLDRVCPWK